MRSREVKIVNKLGLHLRAAAALVQHAEKFRSSVHLVQGGQRSNAKSILSVLSLGAPVGSSITIETSGPDEVQALEALAGFVADRFGEPE